MIIVYFVARIIPAYAIVLVVCATVLPYVADGPHWPPPLPRQCQQQWWMNLLFINNHFVSIEHMVSEPAITAYGSLSVFFPCNFSHQLINLSIKYR
jgi:peptidoglycan/LPS O-acetylase OafA/YrhL